MNKRKMTGIRTLALLAVLLLAWQTAPGLLECPNPIRAAEEDGDHAGHDHGEKDRDKPDTRKDADEDGDHDEDHDKDGQDDGHTSHGQEESEERVHMDERARQRAGIELAAAGSGELEVTVSLPGEIALDPDRVVHLVPRVGGIVKEVHKRLGDPVRRGEVLAVLDSPELADAKAAFLAAGERLKLAQARFQREKDLYEKNISSQAVFLEARTGLAEANIEQRGARQKLMTLGLDAANLAATENREEPDEQFMRYELKAPQDGVVIDKHLSRGEKVESGADVFTLADLSRVWVNLAVYQKDLGTVKAGQSVTLQAARDHPPATSRIDWIAPILDRETRAATARVLLDNATGTWRPGLFVTARVTVDRKRTSVLVPQDAVQQLFGKSVVFAAAAADELEARTVRLGRKDRTRVEILSGLRPGERYVIRGAFKLKAKLVTGRLDAHAGHGH